MLNTATMILMLVTSSGVHVEQIGFESYALCNHAYRQLADKNDVYKKVGWNLDVTCVMTGVSND